MIVDCHAQFWDGASPFAGPSGLLAIPAEATVARYLESHNPVDHAIVLGFKSSYLKAEISNASVAEAVRRYSTRLIGFAGIDPTDENCLDELSAAQDELRLKGVTLSPSLQDFHPTDSRAMRVYAECERRALPLIVDQSMRNPAAKMEYARPMLFDEVAREFPRLHIVIAHIGYPWIDETIALLGKHRNVYANVAGLLSRPWLSYTALLAAHEYGVMEKLLFGSDFPYRAPAACIEALYSLNQIASGTNLATIPREQLRGIVERDALALLGIRAGTSPRSADASEILQERFLGERVGVVEHD